MWSRLTITRNPGLHGIGNSYLNTFLRITRSRDASIGNSLIQDIIFKTEVMGGSVGAAGGGYLLGREIYGYFFDEDE